VFDLGLLGGSSSKQVLDDLLDLVEDQVDNLLGDLDSTLDEFTTGLGDAHEQVQDSMVAFQEFQTSQTQALISLRNDIFAQTASHGDDIIAGLDYIQNVAIAKLQQRQELVSQKMVDLLNYSVSDQTARKEELNQLFDSQKVELNDSFTNAISMISQRTQGYNTLLNNLSESVVSNTQQYQGLLALDRFENELLATNLRTDMISQELDVGSAVNFQDSIISTRNISHFTMNGLAIADIVAVGISAVALSPIAALILGYSLFIRERVRRTEAPILTGLPQSPSLLASSTDYRRTSTIVQPSSASIVDGVSFLSDFGNIGVSDFNVWDSELTDYSGSETTEVWNYFHSMASNTLISDGQKMSDYIVNTPEANLVDFPNFTIKIS
jgi:hypothetical protein